MIDKLEMYLALARERHFGRAAEACGVSQPALSGAIRQLEEQLGVMLVNRGSRYQGLTAEGERVLDWARRIVSDARAMRDEMQAARKGLTGHVRLAVIPTALAAVHEFTTSFLDRHPGVSFTVLSRSSYDILAMIADLEAEIGITYLGNEPLGEVATAPLYVERYSFVTADPEQFEGRERMTWTEAAHAELCLLTADMQNRRIVNACFTAAGVQPRAVLQSDSMIVLISHVLTGRWASILPERLASMPGLASDLRAIPLDEPGSGQQVGVIAPMREPRSPLIESLLRHARSLSGQLPGFDK